MNYLETIKNITKDKQKRVENLIFLIILLVILLVSINYIFKSDEKSGNNIASNSNIINNKDSSTYSSQNVSMQVNLEEKLANILSQINGISDVSVLLTYSSDSKQNIVYNTKEENSDGKTVEEKSVAYNEEGGEKTAIVESVEMPRIEGAIIVAKGANSVDIKSKLASTISNVTGIPVYKVQVFEKQG